ncbi:MAG: type secretion system protein [Phycisphaerales bacterium]|nr:type secretion system protein [Phycisphaerales bacterium]
MTTRSRRRPHPAAAKNGFTLVELLVVIGIIVILVAILLPVAGKVRTQAQSARTQSSMVAIAGAIERYFTDEHSYPGMIRNADITAGAVTVPPDSKPLTSSENLVVTLNGGYVFVAGANPTVNPQEVGKGPLNLSASPVKRVRHVPYVDASSGNLLPAGWDPTVALANKAYWKINGAAGTDNPLDMPGGVTATNIDSSAPEFVDNYSQPRAILYLRANVGGITPPSTPPAGATTDYADDTYQYNYKHLLPYKRDAAGDFAGDFLNFGGTASDEDNLNAKDYFKHPSISDTPRGKDKYLLISAGADRRYGTPDDIIVGG